MMVSISVWARDGGAGQIVGEEGKAIIAGLRNVNKWQLIIKHIANVNNIYGRGLGASPHAGKFHILETLRVYF